MGGPPPSSEDVQTASSLVDGIAALFSAVQSGDEDAANTAATSLQSILDTLTASSDGTASEANDTTTGFLGELQDLLDALKSGDTSESKLWAVLTAYQENGASTTDAGDESASSEVAATAS